MDMKRHSGLWITGRIGILFVFGLMPLISAIDRAHNEHKWDKFNSLLSITESDRTNCESAINRGDFDAADKIMSKWSLDISNLATEHDFQSTNN